MATNSGQLVNALIDGGVSAAAARVIANAIANASTPRYSRGADVSDSTPPTALRMIDSDARKYQFTNLDYSPEAPQQAQLSQSPGQYVYASKDHPYKDSQPVKPTPPLYQNNVVGGDYIDVSNTVADNSQIATVNLGLGIRNGLHLRLNTATKQVDALPLVFSCPQGLVTASVSDDATATNIEVAVRGLNTFSVVSSDGTTREIYGWGPPTQSQSTTRFIPAGAVMSFAALLVAPPGWLLCDGAQYSSASYPDLYSAIGTTYGGSAGSFQVPDLRGYFIRGSGTNSDGTAGGAIGVKNADTIKDHTHSGVTSTDYPDHNHNVQEQGSSSSNTTGSAQGTFNGAARTMTTDGANQRHQHNFTSSSMSPAGGIETRPRNLAMHYYIKT